VLSAICTKELSALKNIEKQLDRITKQYYNEIYQYCRHRIDQDEDAYDLTQEVFLALCAQYTAIDEKSIRKWLYTTAYHKIADFYREKQKKQHLIDAIPLDNLSDDSEFLLIENEHQPEEIEQMIKEIKSMLNDEEKQLLNNRYDLKMDYRSLSQMYDTSETVMRKRISRLKKKIHKIIDVMLHLFIL